MSAQTVPGVVTGAILAVGGAVTRLGDIPFLTFLEQSGVTNPQACLNWLKTAARRDLLHPCFPLNAPSDLRFIANVLVFIAILLLVWAGFELVGQFKKMG